jgi:opacity protein-like surface antigen
MKISGFATSESLMVSGLVILSLAAMPQGLQAAGDSPYELTTRLNLVGGNGEPSNDILGFGFILQRKLTDDWYLGFALDHSNKFDIERPNEELGIDSESETDATGSMTIVSVSAERRYALESDNWTAFWNLGVGVADIDTDNASGDVEGGGSFDIKVEADTETVLMGGAGLIQRLGESWSARYEATFEQHFADWELTDEVSGKTGSYGDYTVTGVRLGLSYRF